MLRGWETALTNLGLAYVIGASDLPLERLSQYRTVVCPTFEFLHRETQQRLAAYIEAGGNLICGPEVPSSDERMREFSTLDHFTSRPTHRLDCEIDTLVCNAGAGRLILVAEVPMPVEKAEAVVKSIARHLHIEPAYPGTPPCETSLHLGPNAEKYLFIVNPTGEPQRPEVQVSTGECLVDLESGETFYGREFVPLAMNPYTVRILEVELC
ncbi:MAG TPA: beta-galactosidase trimerization domain-containing protein [bacterium]|nr:beta-galactosidase trimerization domain-containing protein [bacterium]